MAVCGIVQGYISKMPIFIDLKSNNTFDFLKALLGGPFGFITGIKILSFLHIFFMKILSWDLTSSGGGRYYTPPTRVF